MKVNSTVKEQVAKLLEVKPSQIVIRLVRKLKEDPEFDPILALAVLTPLLEQDQELLQKVDKLVFQNLGEQDPEPMFEVILTDEIVQGKTIDNGMFRSAGRFDKKTIN